MATLTETVDGSKVTICAEYIGDTECPWGGNYHNHKVKVRRTRCSSRLICGVR